MRRASAAQPQLLWRTGISGSLLALAEEETVPTPGRCPLRSLQSQFLCESVLGPVGLRPALSPCEPAQRIDSLAPAESRYIAGSPSCLPAPCAAGRCSGSDLIPQQTSLARPLLEVLPSRLRRGCGEPRQAESRRPSA